ncbi:MAG TPA: hypothetical protein DCP92_10300, partial [Nitrospiraceae bacterium]|nr:hypothetical protein [Nitrospiraceae bacterium]
FRLTSALSGSHSNSMCYFIIFHSLTQKMKYHKNATFGVDFREYMAVFDLTPSARVSGRSQTFKVCPDILLSMPRTESGKGLCPHFPGGAGRPFRSFLNHASYEHDILMRSTIGIY